MSMKIYLDAGHGGVDSGAIGNGLYEKYLTLSIVLKIKKLLDHYNGVQVKLSRDDDSTLSLKQRTDEANKWGANLFVSVHINAGGGVGYEDFIYSNLKSTSSTVKIRDIIHNEITSHVNFKNRGKKKANFHVLRESKMSAILTENGFIDSVDDSGKLKNEKFIQDIAQGHVNGIVKAFDLKKKVVKEVKSGQVFYRVVSGSFSDRENAETRVKDLEGKGFKSFIDIYKK